MLAMFIAAMLAATAAQATSTVPAGTPGGDVVVKGEKPKELRRICRTETPTGSSFSKRICRTVAEIEEQRAQSARFTDEVSRIQTLQQTTDRDNGPK